jgi:ankyrin repeat protein
MNMEELTKVYDRDPLLIYDLIDNGLNVNVMAYRRVSFLMYVVKRSDDAKLVKALIDAGADVHARNLFGRTPLMISAKNKDAPEVLRILLDAGSDANAVDDYGNTAFKYAEMFCRCGNCCIQLEEASKNNCINFKSI